MLGSDTEVEDTGSYYICLTQQPTSQPGNHPAGLATAFIHVFIHASRCTKFYHCLITVTAPALCTTFDVVREYPNKGYVLHGKKKINTVTRTILANDYPPDCSFGGNLQPGSRDGVKLRRPWASNRTLNTISCRKWRTERHPAAAHTVLYTSTSTRLVLRCVLRQSSIS